MSEVKHVDVAAAVMTRPDGHCLLGQRAPGTFYPGYWEFPGGKVEAGELPRDALARELAEELGIEVTAAVPWLTRRHEYAHAHVTLHFFTVHGWRGDPSDHVHAALSWQDPQAMTVAPLLPANGPILKSLRLPRVMGVTCAERTGIEAQLRALDAALQRGLRLVQVREPTLADDVRREFCRQVVARTRECGAITMVNDDAELAMACGADGVHLTARSLIGLRQRPALEWVGASCHSRDEIDRACALAVDYVTVGSVLPTPTHPDGRTLGWAAFERLIAGLPVPAFAIGGIGADQLERAQVRGAHGIAMIRGAWAAPTGCAG
ncbi:MAG: Nudix family hydrolase [Rhodocyclaceae bacterium]|nr:Nudix family hydrolase [Rhodocyclaceae bacterium]